MVVWYLCSAMGTADPHGLYHQTQMHGTITDRTRIVKESVKMNKRDDQSESVNQPGRVFDH